MISLRYHVVSIAAFFLALAVGVVLGSTTVSDRLLAGVSSSRDELGRQVSDLQTGGNALRAQVADGNAFALTVGPRAVRGVLAGRSVVVVTTADAAPADRDALIVLLGAAGATVTGELQLTDAFSDPFRADQLSELTARLLPAGVQLPAATDAGTQAGALLGALLLLNLHNGQPQATPLETASALAGLRDGGFLRYDRPIQPGQLAAVLTGNAARGEANGGNGADRAAVVARFATQLDRSGTGTVLAGGPGSAAGTGPIGVVRADIAAASILSTVDDAGTAAGRVVAVLALAEQGQGRAGQYGTAGNAQSAAPPSGG
ncbi:MAG TPA: copper transporter [Pseudonocardiaceae bacterium]